MRLFVLFTFAIFYSLQFSKSSFVKSIDTTKSERNISHPLDGSSNTRQIPKDVHPKGSIMNFNPFLKLLQLFKHFKSFLHKLILSVFPAHPDFPIFDISNTENCEKLIWAGKYASKDEATAVADLRNRAKNDKSGSVWLSSVSDIELLRFLRGKNGRVNDAWNAIVAHSKWRSSKYGADGSFTKTSFANSPLKLEAFWLGPNKENCPTLVIRTQLHDGFYYNDDPKIYARYYSSLYFVFVHNSNLIYCD